MFRVKNSKDIQTGIVKRHPDGFGFFIPDDSKLPDVYVPKQFMHGIMTNDKVEMRVFPEPGGQRFRGEVVRVLQRASLVVIGKYKNLNEMYGIILDTNNNWGTNLSIPKAWAMKANDDDLVVVQITSYPEKKEPFLGKVIEILGDATDPMFDIKKVIYSHNLPHVFGESVEKEAKEFSLEVDPTQFKNRKDLTQIPLITIDGKTAKDFDDAIYVESIANGFRLIVAIADVSHYVKVNSPIDKEAYTRGTSTYFPNFVIPMLPEVLSNELCSLKPNVYRLCCVADMKVDFQGNVTHSEFYEGIMKSHARVTYGEAQEVIDGATPEAFKHVEHVILKANDLAKIFMAKRFREGALDLEIPETELILDETGMPIDIQRSERIFAHKLIEEMMLAANVAVAKFIGDNEEPVLYRIHEQPKMDNIETLNHYLKNFGSSKKLGTKKLQKDISAALQDFAGKPEEIVLHILTLRSMNQAKYSPENIGHFGLGFEHYAHFTSPIRRYPDLIVHRVLKHVLKIPGYEIPAQDSLESAGTMLSACEQRSVKAERQLYSIKKARFMQKYLGEEFDGIISSVAKFGVFVLLRQFDIDGLIKVEELGNDMFLYDADNMILSGKRSGFKYSIGDTLKIQVASCDVNLGQINFVLKEKPAQLVGSRHDSRDDRKSDRRNRDDRKGGEKRFGKRGSSGGGSGHGGNRNKSGSSSGSGSGGGSSSGMKFGRRDEKRKDDKTDQRGGKGESKSGTHEKGDRPNFEKRSKNENNRGGSGKTRFSKRSGKGKAR